MADKADADAPQPAASPSEPERAAAVTRVVLDLLAEREDERQKALSRWTRTWAFLSAHWSVLASVLAVLALALASWSAGGSLFYPFEELAFREKELKHKERQFDRAAARARFDRAMARQQVEVGTSFLSSGQYEEAEGAFKQALAFDPVDTLAALGLAKAQVFKLSATEQYQPEVVAQRLDFLLRQRPADPHVHTALGNLYYSLDPQRAVAHYQRALAADSTVAEAHFGLATFHLKQSQPQQARKHSQRAVQLSGWNTRYLENLAYVYMQLGKYGEASEYYHKLLDLDSQFLSTYFELGVAYRLAGSLQGARQSQENLVASLADTALVKLPKNQSRLYFPTARGAVYLDGLTQKQCYAFYSLSATLFLLGERTEAADRAAQARKVCGSSAADIRDLLVHDMDLLQRARVEWKDGIEAYKTEYLQARSDG